MQKYHKEVKELIKHEFTLYPSREVNGRTHRGRAPALVESNGEDGSYIAKEYTGVTIHVIESHNGYYYAGVAIQMKDDQFNRKIGRNIAKGRAELCLYAYLGKHGNHSGAMDSEVSLRWGGNVARAALLERDAEMLRKHGSIPGVSVV